MTIIWYIGWCRFFCGVLRILTAHRSVQPNFFLYVNGRLVNNHIFFWRRESTAPEWILIYFLLKEWTATKRGDADDEIQNLSYKSDVNISSKRGRVSQIVYIFEDLHIFFCVWYCESTHCRSGLLYSDECSKTRFQRVGGLYNCGMALFWGEVYIGGL